MNIIFWIIFGLIVGTLANIIDPSTSRGGILGSIILGILGAILGGILGNIVFGIGVTGFNLPSIAVATLGALLLLFIERAFRRSS
ncbi:GlsB/YeaQ/YmgE family stress response membrane protein [Candidatus Daviesbacteria bacterium]|nr:GlsB/YeaQ/YmgE family stress response membrane protein [Candidatus Daviesbacteria bacterium]